MAFCLPSDERGASCLSSETACEFASSGDKADISSGLTAKSWPNPGKSREIPGTGGSPKNCFFFIGVRYGWGALVDGALL